ncbi:LPXTG cell wall anchor domain-containing protein [Streptomyces sp. NPDC051315]|uniref:LPXTG cell wall anchor domain-containing protein n=1 Tax=Streptomyces sp. NPDC051315 TaxID=3365650 RepID=UPI00378F4F80
MRTFARAGFFLAVSSAVVLLAPAAHATGDDTYTVELRQELPRTATTDDGGAPRESREECPGVPDGKDGWHFVVPGKEPEFVKLTVTFEPGGQQVLTSFGPPSDQHAYVWSLPGAELTSAVAEVRGGELELFNLSHTCPVRSTPSGSAEPSTGTSAEPSSSTSASTEPSSGTSAEPSTGTSTSAEPSAGTSTGPAESPGEVTPGDGGAAAPSASTGAGGGDLAETGNGAPVGALSAVAAVLVAAGGFLVVRRRRGARQG